VLAELLAGSRPLISDFGSWDLSLLKEVERGTRRLVDHLSNGLAAPDQIKAFGLLAHEAALTLSRVS